MKTALYQAKLEDGRVRCDLCPHHCVIAEGADGRCRVRGVRGGELKALFYGLPAAANLDPIEKKPLYHFHPGRVIFSIGGWGCNLSCDFCQNWSISQMAETGGRSYEPEGVVAKAGQGGSVGIAYTYNEPVVGYEFMKDCAAGARKAGLANVMVTNGFIETGPAAEILPLIDAINLDIKSMDEEFYKRRCGGKLAPVLEFAKQAVKAGCHLEITNLIIPGANTGMGAFDRLSSWIADNLGDRVPLHLSAYHADYKAREPNTSPGILESAWSSCSRKLRYVYMGNIRIARGQSTMCPQCGALLVERFGYAVRIAGIRNGRCAKCGAAADFKGLPSA